MNIFLLKPFYAWESIIFIIYVAKTNKLESRSAFHAGLVLVNVGQIILKQT